MKHTLFIFLSLCLNPPTVFALHQEAPPVSIGIPQEAEAIYDRSGEYICCLITYTSGATMCSEPKDVTEHGCERYIEALPE